VRFLLEQGGDFPPRPAAVLVELGGDLSDHVLIGFASLRRYPSDGGKLVVGQLGELCRGHVSSGELVDDAGEVLLVVRHGVVEQLVSL
jgi:hypothetical protein